MKKLLLLAFIFFVLDEGMYCVLNVHHDAGDAKSCWLRADMEMKI